MHTWLNWHQAIQERRKQSDLIHRCTFTLNKGAPAPFFIGFFMKKLLLFLPLIFLSFYCQASAAEFPTTGTARDVGGIFDCAENGKSYNIASVLSCLENRFVPYEDYKTTTCYLRVDRFGGRSICNITGGDYEGQTVMMNGWYGLQCPPNTEKNRENMCESTCEHGTNDDGSCREKCDYGSNEDGTCRNKCEFSKAVDFTVDLSWFPMATGNDVQFGCYYTGGIYAEYCTMQQTGENEVRCTGVVDGHVTAETRCTTQFSYTGRTCTEGDEPFWGDGKGSGNPDDPDNPDEPEEPDNPDEPEEPDNDDPDLDIPPFDPPVSDSEFPPIDTPDEPDVEEPDTDDDSGVITAITGQNKDINTNFSNLITANNTNFATLNGKLQTLNANTVALNNNVGTQLRQDYDIYKLEKQNREKQTDALKKAVQEENERLIESLSVNNQELQEKLELSLEALQSGLGSKIEASIDIVSGDLTNGFSQLGTQLGSHTNEIVGAIDGISGQLDGVVDALGDTSGALGSAASSLNGVADSLEDLLEGLEPCEPNQDNRYCENPHGLSPDFVGTALGQADSVFSDSLVEYEKTITDAAQSIVDQPLTPESESHIASLSSDIIGILPKPTSCVDLSFPTFGGERASIDCKFSQQLKMILSLLIYIYTLKTLAEILLNEVTPVPSNKPGSARYY
ncbi:hypothetical protein Vca1114GL_00402 [Vibrio campbellii]|nr:hypothetical protein Vca1114GL_00402 [Vibrio campbellii]